MSLNESHVEEATLTWFGELGYAIGHGPLLAPGEAAAERASFADGLLVGRSRDTLLPKQMNGELGVKQALSAA